MRTQNLHFLRPEKTWRPIVTLEVDDIRRSSYEVVLGTDGQNPNLKQPMLLYVSSDFPLLMCLNALARQRRGAP